MVFNGAKEGLVNKYGYNLIGRKRFSQPDLFITTDFIAGLYSQNDQPVPITRLDTYNPQQGSNNKICLQHDAENLVGSAKALFGYGKYQVDLWYTQVPFIETPPDEFFTIDIDADYGIGGPAWYDLRVFWYGPNDVKYQIGAYCENTPLPVNKNIEVWNPCTSHTRPKNPGNFKYDRGTTETPNPYVLIPLVPRRECTAAYLPGAPYQNHEFLQDKIGALTLNLTIEKNEINGNPIEIKTPNIPYSIEFLNFPPIIIDRDAKLILAKGNNNLERKMRFRKYHDYFANTFLEVYPYGTLELQGSSNLNEKSHIYFESYSNAVIWQNANLIMGENSAIDISGNSLMKFKGASKIYQYSGTNINIYGPSVVLDCGAQYPVSNGCLYTLQSGGRFITSNRCPEDFNDYNEFLVENGTSFELYDNSVIEIADNCKMIFSGENTYLKAEPGTSVILGEGASIEFRNGAYLDADGCTFTSINSGEIWNGIVLDGAGSQTNIQNCTFNDAAASIEVTNTVCSITDNTFNISNNTSCLYGINAVNETNITIAGNTFNAGSNSTAECLKFFNYDGDGLPGGGGAPVYYLNIFNNTFNGGVYAVDIQCLTASQLPFYISYNSFNPSMGITYAGIFAYNISGNIKNNTFYNSYSNKAVSLQFSAVNVYNNTLHSAYQNIWSNNSTIMQMSPIENEYGQWVWFGGYNKLTSVNNYNIEFRTYSNPFISPNGNNCFTVNTQPNFLGELCLGTKPYSAYDNYWSPAVSSSSFDITCNSNPVNVTYTPNLTECPDINPGDIIGSNISSIGGSLYDTVYITSSGGSGGSEEGNLNKTKKSANTDKILYYNAIQKRKQKDYADAINKCKELINNHDTSIYFNSALSELYLNYLNSDTSGNQTITNGLYSNLKTYIEQKMQQYQNNAQFIERAYKYLLMCLVKIKSYSEAVAGYENIMNNHPDPIVRLNASWDRSAVVFMMGQGGSLSDNSIINSKSKIKKLLDKNPAHRIAKDIFKVQKEESDRIETENELYGDNSENKNRIVYTKEEKRIFESRIENYNPVNEKEFIEKLSGDIKVMEQVNTAKTTNKVLTNIPKTYKLYQNYPNPFNPTTIIKYEIPKNAQVTLKVYDILGKEVFSYNEYKLAGSYEVKFDGSNLASGMYFYTLETNGYKDTKKMVLLK